MIGENQMTNSFDKACIPILVGITGHRDVENEQKLSGQIKKVLFNLCEKYQASPILLLTPLAEGADRTAAKAVTELREMNVSKISYMVILPMDEEEYKGTFSNKESICEYEFLKSQAIGCYRVPVSDALDIDKIQDKEKRHSKLYANMGTYIALNTQILIAAWNGAEEEPINHCKDSKENMGFEQTCVSDGARCPYFSIKHGGTYHILRIRFFGVEDEYRGCESFLTNREFGPVYWIKTKRRSSAYLEDGISVIGPVYPDYPIDYSKYDLYSSNSQHDNKCRKLVKERIHNPRNLPNSKNSDYKTYDEILLKLDEYNSDISKMYPMLAEKIKKVHHDFLTYSYAENYEDKKEVFSFHSQENSLIHRFAAADTLSLHYQGKRKRDVVFLIILAFLGLLSFNLYSGPLASNWLILSYSAVYFFGSLYYIYKVKANRYHKRYVDYRGIAEGLRVQFFWHLAAVKTRVGDKYLTKQKSSIDWIRVALNTALLLCKAKDEESKDNLKYKDNIYTAYKLWLLNQYDYYNRKWPEKDRTERVQKKVEKALFILGLALAIVLTCLDTYELFSIGTNGIHKMFLAFNIDSEYKVIHQWLVFVVGFLPVIIASFKVFTELLAYSKLARNYKWMCMVYNIALHEFKRLKNNHESDVDMFVEKSRRLFYDIGVEALLENGEWIGVFDERVPEMPK